VGVTAQESNTYTDFALINFGGLKEDGTDGVNDLTYIILDVIEEMRLVQPSTMVQVSKHNPQEFLKKAIHIIKTGFGQPSVFNTDAIIQELVNQGKGLEDARLGGASGCVESGAFGKEAYILTGYFNLPKIAEVTLNNGMDPRTGIKVGPETGDPSTFETYDKFFEAFSKQVRHFVDLKIEGNNIIDRLYAEYLPVPFLSTLIDDCIENARDYHNGGARYNTSYIQGVGLGTVTDTLTSIKHNVFENGNVTMVDLKKALSDDFEGHEDLRERFLGKTPKYGNDEEYPDGLMKAIFELYHDSINGRPNARGGEHRVNLLPTTVHVYFGSVTGALPDGRKAWEPLSEGISPVQGADRNGPTSVLKSAGKLDQLRTGGTLLNQKFTPQLLADDVGIDKMASLIRSYFKMNGHHVQFNVVTADVLKNAQLHPEKHRDLIVRVAGYSDYFVDLTQGLQDEIIKRTEHGDT
jgi:formate C-acetyltransferase